MATHKDKIAEDPDSAMQFICIVLNLVVPAVKLGDRV